MRAVPVYVRSKPDEMTPLKDAIRQMQRQDRKKGGATVVASTSFTIILLLGELSWSRMDCFVVVVDGLAILWIPSRTKYLQVRLMVCVHMKHTGHRGVAAAPQRLKE